MKTLATTLVLACAALFSQLALACDETCRKEAAEKELNVKFPGYLSWDYCDDIRMDFMTGNIRSLENYKSNHFDPRYKGGMRNIAKFVRQRQDWLKECDEYLTHTGKNRIFEDDATTASLFRAMDRLERELEDLANGVVYTTEVGADPTEVVGERFDDLFKLVEDHKTLMHLKGKYVFR